MTPNETLAVLSLPGIALIVGAIPGAWLGYRKRERACGHLWLAGIVGILSVVAVTLYTVSGAKEELFSRVVLLPFTLLLAVVTVALLLGVPLYVGYIVAHRIASRMSGGA